MSWHRVLSPKENLRVCLLKVVLGLHRFWGKRGAAGTEIRRPKSGELRPAGKYRSLLSYGFFL